MQQHVFRSQEKGKLLWYTFLSMSPRINLYLYSGNYGEDTISNHIVDCYLFPGRCRIRHAQGIRGMCWIELNILFSGQYYKVKLYHSTLCVDLFTEV